MFDDRQCCLALLPVLQAVLASSFRDSSGNLTHSVHTTQVNVVGCNAARLAAPAAQFKSFSPPGKTLYTAYSNSKNITSAAPAKPVAVAVAAAADDASERACVRGPKFWRSCLTAAGSNSSQQQMAVDQACLIINQRLPGGKGPATPFFQLRNSQAKHTYGSILLADPSNSSSSSAFLKIAQSYVAAQLNQLSGVALPPIVRQAQVLLAAKYFSVVGEKSSVKKELQKKAAAAEAVLSSFNTGKMPGTPACKQQI
jgi:hypothetical protein